MVGLHIAILVPDGWGYESFVSSIRNWNNGSGKEGKPPTHPDKLIAAHTVESLKEQVRYRINKNPDERWLLLFGNTIAEYQEPPVRFYQW